LPSFTLPPGEKRDYKISLQPLKPQVESEYFLNVFLHTTKSWGLLGNGHLLASEQFSLPTLGGKTGLITTGRQPVLNVEETDDLVSIKWEQFSIGFDKKEGTLSTWKFQNTELILRGLLPNFRRAPTDNDVGNGMAKRCKVWFEASEYPRVVSTTVKKISEREVLITVQFTFPDSIATETVAYLVTTNGTVKVTATLKPLKEQLPELPRFGLNMQLKQEFSRLGWYGRGPWENYCDRNKSSFVGNYESTVDAQFTPYVRPQENGYKTDVRWMELKNTLNTGIKFTGQPLICFSALPYTYDDLKGFKHGGKHLHELARKPFIDLNLDYGQMGVGGDDSWGARPHEQYTLPAGSYNFSFMMEAISNKEPVK
jgi:beta-galactosidase